MTASPCSLRRRGLEMFWIGQHGSPERRLIFTVFSGFELVNLLEKGMKPAM